MLMLVQFFTPAAFFKQAYNIILDWKQVVLGFTFILGTWSLIRYHYTKISRRRENWQYSYVTLAGLAATVTAALVWKTATGPYPWLFNNVQVPMQSTVFALLAFFVASAAYRGFRLRNIEAGILLVTALIIMLGRIPIGELISGYIPATAEWILTVPSMSAKRAVLIGIGLGSITTALRVILGIERSYLGKG